ncbi:MAG: excinuclease ABC subunit UvrB [Planctomycetota bacterium]|jgi:excinuclease ABC subunit B|nr:excinuclease ABC subunit UvrB [Planctomycetota bacterium]
MPIFKLNSAFTPAGQQPEAIERLTGGARAGLPHQTLLGVTGSGKTFVMANLIARMDKPALILSHNKTLTAQLYSEFRQFFPENAVEYFVSYYDFYQPEAYIPQTDAYIEKDAAINDDLERLRLSATSALLTRRDVVVVASVSCIYGLGRPQEYRDIALTVQIGDEVDRREFLTRLVRMEYQRNDFDFQRGTFRLRGDALDVWPAYSQSAIRIEMAGDTVEDIHEFAPLTGELLMHFRHRAIFPATHFVLSESAAAAAVDGINDELAGQLALFKREEKLLEAQRLESRTRYDLEMIEEIGYCKGIENYSRHFDGRKAGERPACLFDYFPERDWLLIVDESHVTLPQVRGMYNGDQARKKVLVEHGFRLPSALDNRPLKWEEFRSIQPQTIYVSATPAPYELGLSEEGPVELLVRPTGLTDPPVEVRPTKGQVPDIMGEIQARAARGERVLVTTLTKRLAEELDSYCRERGLKTAYLHSDIHTLDRVEILRDLRIGTYDALIGVNLLREGLDLPEVSLVVILDADKEGFLRNATSLIQIIGRCARNTEGRVILYADRITDAMRKTMDETGRRREAQLEFNAKHGIIPTSVKRGLETGLEEFFGANEEKMIYIPALGGSIATGGITPEEEIRLLQQEMEKAAADLHFEEAARLRDRLLDLKAPISYVGNRPKARAGKAKARSKGGRRRRDGPRGLADA